MNALTDSTTRAAEEIAAMNGFEPVQGMICCCRGTGDYLERAKVLAILARHFAAPTSPELTAAVDPKREQHRVMLQRIVDELNDTSTDCLLVIWELNVMRLEDALASANARADAAETQLANQEEWDVLKAERDTLRAQLASALAACAVKDEAQRGVIAHNHAHGPLVLPPWIVAAQAALAPAASAEVVVVDRKEWEEAKKDGERLDFLINTGRFIDRDFDGNLFCKSILTSFGCKGETGRAAIDAARAPSVRDQAREGEK